MKGVATGWTVDVVEQKLFQVYVTMGFNTQDYNYTITTIHPCPPTPKPFHVFK